MNKNGGYTWIQTCATIVCSIKNNDEQNIICVNYVVTNREQSNMILDQCQLGIIKREPIVYPKVDNEPKSPNDNSNNSESSRSHHEAKKMSSNQNKSLENTSKEVKNSDEDATSGKRGRKRKVKAETKQEEASDITVKELENVMSKHLPKSIEGSTDFRTDTLLRNSDASNSFPSTSNAMPATALLRQLYANRESVIRATSRPANYMYSENQQQSLPTPPNDTSYDYRKSSAEVFGYGYADYNNAMTPPSSVSPRDLTNHKTSNYEYTNLTPSSSSASDVRVNYQSDIIKPHPYSIHQMDHHSSSYGLEHQSQYFSPYHTGFHLYHKNIYTPP